MLFPCKAQLAKVLWFSKVSLSEKQQVLCCLWSAFCNFLCGGAQLSLMQSQREGTSRLSQLCAQGAAPAPLLCAFLETRAAGFALPLAAALVGSVQVPPASCPGKCFRAEHQPWAAAGCCAGDLSLMEGRNSHSLWCYWRISLPRGGKKQISPFTYAQSLISLY